MKITANAAVEKITAGTAWVTGKMSDGNAYPEGDQYWIITDSAKMETHHVLVSEAPDLDQLIP
jgi:hypothetical protein